MDDQAQLKNQLRDERLKVKAQRKIIRDYELKIVELSHFANTLKDKVVRRHDEDFTNQEVSEAMIRELMKTIEDQHTIIAERDKTIVKQGKELEKYTRAQLDQQPPSSQGEQDDDCILFDTDLSLNKENEPFPILDDYTIRVHTPTGLDMQSKDDSKDDSKDNLKPNASHNGSLPSSPQHALMDTTVQTSNSQTTSSAEPSVIKDNSSQKSEKTIYSKHHISQKSSTQVPFGYNTKHVKVKKECHNGTSNLIQTKLTDKTNTQPSEGKKRKIPSSLTVSIKPKKMMTQPVNDENQGYAYYEPSKSKHERAKMNGNTCTCCQGYFHGEKPIKEFGTDKEMTAEERIQLHSRHRSKHEAPKTPPGFWEVDFPSSFDDQFGSHNI